MERKVLQVNEAKEYINMYINFFLENDDEITIKYLNSFRAIQNDGKLMNELAKELADYTQCTCVDNMDINEYIYNHLKKLHERM